MKKKKVILFLVFFFWIIGLVLSFYFGSQQANKKNDKPKDDLKKEIKTDKKLKGISLKDTYDANSININTVSVGPDLSYLQISGLKDKNIEKKINSTIKELFQKKHKESTNDKGTNLMMYLTFNGNNIFSFDFVGNININNETKNFSEGYTINLINGEFIPFVDLFNDETVINSLLTKALIFSGSQNNISYCSTDEETETNNNCTANDLNAQLEGEVFKLLSNLDYKDVDYYLADNGINFYINGELYSINIKKDGQYLAYGDKYKTKESLYEKDFALKNIPFGMNSVNLLYYNKKNLNDYNFIDALVFFNDDITDKSFDIINKVYKVDDILKSYADNTNKTKFTYIYFSSELYANKKYKLYQLNYELDVCKMKPDYFNKTGKTQIAYTDDSSFSVSENAFPYFSQDTKNVKCLSLSDGEFSKVYNFDNKLVEKPSDIFKDNYDYKSAIIKYLNDNGMDVNKTDFSYIIPVADGLEIPYDDYSEIIGYEVFDQKEFKN